MSNCTRSSPSNESCGESESVDLRKKLNLEVLGVVVMGLGKPDDFRRGRLVRLSSISWLLENMASKVSASWIGSNFSFRGEGTNVMLTGSEEPSNQLANLSAAVLVLFFLIESSDGFSREYSAALATDTLSGDRERVLCGRKKGRNDEGLVGEEDCVLATKGGKSATVRER